MKLATVLLLVSGLLSPALFAAQQVDQQAQLSAGAKVDIRVQRGNVEVNSWDKDEIAVKGSLDARSEGLIFQQKGNNFVVEDKLPHRLSGSDDNGSALQIFVPKQINLKIKGISANYQLQQLEGNIDTASISGNIKLNTLKGDINVRSVSGDINTKDVAGKLMLESVSGNIHDQNSSGSARYRVVSGDLTSSSSATDLYADVVSGSAEIQLSQLDSLELHAVSGNIKVTLANISNKAQLDSVSGDIDLIFSTMPDVEFSINGGPGGDIHNKLSDDKPVKAKYTGAENLKFQLGSGKADFYITTISGGITLKRQ
ncbi:hypothetical protein HR45_10025 [Shewanella mangrovi]|uniref:DUF4097 domain-containing protein n=1 Tax=Shewanella mangrovi TaxID=1515746 RepID=A0A094JDT8_9GAMM|nr:DUF4097 family beta strand repeat-containing protein [Shewanella mangrovi]KFZ37352.1 hypothetical protein HR45_10025 [Shewanella mangrovi]